MIGVYRSMWTSKRPGSCPYPAARRKHHRHRAFWRMRRLCTQRYAERARATTAFPVRRLLHALEGSTKCTAICAARTDDRSNWAGLSSSVTLCMTKTLTGLALSCISPAYRFVFAAQRQTGRTMPMPRYAWATGPYGSRCGTGSRAIVMFPPGSAISASHVQVHALALSVNVGGMHPPATMPLSVRMQHA